jgi:signal transduction histidine kinase
MAQATLAQEEERRRISRELHDSLGPSLADLSNRLGVCRQLVRGDPAKAETGIDEVSGLLRGYIKEIRELINELRPLALDQLGLAGALQQYLERFRDESGIQASMTVEGSLTADPLTEVTIYRVVQESLTNVRKHSGATSVQVAMRRLDGSIEIAVSDDGRGFDSEATASRTDRGLGLTSMRERAELVGGTFTVTSRPGGGCRTVLRIPARG